MTPRPLTLTSAIQRGPFLTLALGLFFGCSPLSIRPQSPDTDVEEVAQEEESKYQSVGSLTVAQGMGFQKVESVALVTGLSGGGSDPSPSPQRNRLIAEMQTHSVKNPSRLLASPSTSMVLVRGYLPPGVQKGDLIDVEVRIRSGSETKSLRGGWLLRSRLRRMEVLSGSIKTGDVIALAEGAVLIDAMFEGSDDSAFQTRGRVLGGGESLKSRPLGLAVRHGSHSAMTTSMISSAINKRFSLYVRGSKRGVATAKTDRYIELAVHPRYKNNISRYMGVVRSIAVHESPIERIARIQVLERQLLEPTSAATAAARLEAIGNEAISVLSKGMESSDAEVRFYSAEALAYLDHADAASVLSEYVEHEQAFRWHALTALAAIDHVDAYEGLTRLLHVTSTEARYGAFRALRSRNPQDPLVRGEGVSPDFDYHVLPSNGEPLVHFSRSRKAEIVVFGHDQTINQPGVLFAGENIMIKSLENGRLKAIRYIPGQEQVSRECSAKLDDLIRTVIDLGVDYEGLLLFMQQAKLKGHLKARLVVDAVPSPWRTYRQRQGTSDTVEPDNNGRHVTTPLPELFRTQPDDQGDSLN